MDGWVNIDGWRSPAVDYIHDMRKQLPLSDESTCQSFSEHVLEHFTLEDGEKILEDFYRVLSPGGTLRIIVPGLAEIFSYYSTGSQAFAGTSFARFQNRSEAVNNLFYGHFHRAIYDFDMLCSALRRAGFEKVRHASFRDSRIDDLNCDSDGIDRIATSLYVEATK